MANIKCIYRFFLTEIFVIILICALINGCATLNRSAYVVSMIQSPIVYKQNRNESTGTKQPIWEDTIKEIKKDESGNPIAADSQFDDYSDLENKYKIVGVAMSGGGARAAYFSSAVLKTIEELYRHKYDSSLNKNITFYSSVSGSSITNSIIGIRNEFCTNDSSNIPSDAQLCDQYDSFEWVHRIISGDWKKGECANLSNIATSAVFSPLNFGIPFFYTIFTNQGYSRYLSLAMDICLKSASVELGNHYHNGHELFDDYLAMSTFSTKYSLVKLSNLGGSRSRHYFNSTILDTGSRFVFSNRRYHQSYSEPLEKYYLNDPLLSDKQNSKAIPTKRLSEITFLEDINSSINDFSASDAVIASMSFPGITEPVELQIFEHPQKGADSKGSIQIIDGGVYDNSGLETLLDIIKDQIQINNKFKQEIIVLLIDSDNETMDALEVNTFCEKANSHEPMKHLSIGLPIKGLLDGVNSAMLLHSLNKKRAMKLSLLDTVDWLKSLPKENSITLTILPISLNEIYDKKMIKEISNVPTDFSISESDTRVLDEAVNILMNSSYDRSIKTFARHTQIEKYPETLRLFPDPNHFINKTLGEVIIESVNKKTDPLIAMASLKFDNIDTALQNAQFIERYLKNEWILYDRPQWFSEGLSNRKQYDPSEESLKKFVENAKVYVLKKKNDIKVAIFGFQNKSMLNYFINNFDPFYQYFLQSNSKAFVKEGGNKDFLFIKSLERLGYLGQIANGFFLEPAELSGYCPDSIQHGNIFYNINLEPIE